MAAPNSGKTGAAAAVTLSDSPAANYASPTDFIYVGVAGNVVAIMANGASITFANAQIGWHPICAVRFATATTAASIVACWDGTT